MFAELRNEIIAAHRAAMIEVEKIPSPYRRRREEERLRKETVRKLCLLNEAESEARLRAYISTLESLKHDRGMIIAVRRYDGHTQYGWEVACGRDGRIKKLTREIGWTATLSIIKEIRGY